MIMGRVKLSRLLLVFILAALVTLFLLQRRLEFSNDKEIQRLTLQADDILRHNERSQHVEKLEQQEDDLGGAGGISPTVNPHFRRPFDNSLREIKLPAVVVTYEKQRKRQLIKDNRESFATQTKLIITDRLRNEHIKREKEYLKTHSVNASSLILGELFDVEGYLGPQRDIGDHNHPMEMFQFNQYASDHTAYNRTLGNIRDPKCITKYDNPAITLPITSVVICFHNEARSALLRTIYSVLSRSPPELIQEVVLVDDYSNDVQDGKLLQNIPKVKLIRLNERRGLIQARIVGAKASRGRVLTFLDSHCEVTFGWLEPLLARIHEGITHVVSPVIDIIDKNDMKYTPANPNIKGGFGHNLQFKWDQLDTVELQERQRDHTSPITTPAIAGGLFAINKSYFEHIGMYDEQMEIWGGENVEISMRIWMCGGTLEIMPCSRVGHIFRSTMPYTFGRGKTYHSTVTKNFRRTAEVWMDNYKHLFYETNPYAIYVSYGNISSRVELRKRLKCKSFEWYINEIYPEFVSGSKQEVVKLSGHLHQDSGCLQTLKDSLRTIAIDNCTKSNKIWTFTNNGRIKYLSLCLTVSNPIFPTDVYLATCSNDSLKANQLFEWYKVNSTQNTTIMIKHKSSGNCLITKSTNESFQHNKILLSKCNSEEKYHQWLL